MIKQGHIIAITGVDGSGKSTLAEWLKDELRSMGYKPRVLWSRYNNYLSLPFLALTKLTGHNYYKINNDVRMGYHNFECYPVPLKWIFAVLQLIDVNLATFFKITIPSSATDITICERGPWDTIVDVIADTNFKSLELSSCSRLFYWQILQRSHIILIDRDIDKIYMHRPELIHDDKLERRKLSYLKLAENNNWLVLENNESLEKAKEKLKHILNEIS